ncbi:hypothetical protein HPB47_021468 [Ixodes persulcatus]|uniref:Uncharacterized protein n=1 Tax=Ixodes persulcatus TaxID=34615 RepID=A0AC60QFY7_IXOPE|nr:hypothetical protein HPB47_021468 [Ixodes persulcatus]
MLVNPVAGAVFSSSHSPVGLRKAGALITRGGGDRVAPLTPGHVYGACRNYLRGRISKTALRILKTIPGLPKYISSGYPDTNTYKTGTILTPYLLQRFRQHSSSHREKGNGAATTNLSGTCALCHKNADLEHLLWDCPLYSEPRTRTLATIQQSFRPTSLHAWACPDPSFPKVTAIELWRSLLAYVQDPAAPPVGTRLQGGPLSPAPVP